MDREESKGKPETFIKEVTFILAVTFAGVALQFVTGAFDFAILAFPVNLIFLLIFIVLMAVRPSNAIGRFGTLSISIILISVLIILSIIMGLVPENNVKNSWPFVLTYLMLLVNLALVIGRRIRTFKLKDTGFMLNHLGLFILLFSASFGSADMERYFMKVDQGDIEWRGRSTKTGVVVELPVAVQLTDFKIEEYQTKLALVSRKTGELLPEGKPQYSESKLNSKSHLGEWSIIVDSIIDRKKYAPAAYIEAINENSGDEHKGWVSCGNYFQSHKVLNLTDEYCIAMTYPEPKSFSSEVEVFKEGGASKKGIIQVNHPLTIGQWKIYQYSYNTQMGRNSDYSVFELVYDPWLIPAYAGIIMLFTGVMTLFCRGARR
ncbi:MAG: cytochrome c biogenesis protein ResB [Bacteroidales bacterium]